MSNKRAHYIVLREMADEVKAELSALIEADNAERGYSEGAREELALRERALREASEVLALEWDARAYLAMKADPSLTVRVLKA